jgi:hypothetical protein
MISENASAAPNVIGPDTPLRLHPAAQILFPDGSVTASSLRREAKRGRLQIERIANKQFTTLRAMEQMRQLCRERPKEYVSGLSPKSATELEGLSAAPHGSSVMECARSARAADQQALVPCDPSRHNLRPCHGHDCDHRDQQCCRASEFVSNLIGAR